MADEQQKFWQAVQADPRYPPEAYEFLCHALTHTQRRLGRVPVPGDDPRHALDKHVSGPELCEGVRQYALQQFGPMAFAVFRQWNVRATGDVGNMVWHLVERQVWHRAPGDRLEDFHQLYDLERALGAEAPIELGGLP